MLVQVWVTIPAEQADGLAKMLLEERVCACVNVVPRVRSHYWWDGKIESSDEAMLCIKTKDSLFGRVKEMIGNNHPYEVPEIIGVRIDSAHKPYLDWVNKEANAAPYTREP
ncbi:MAG: divalent cation tolerance protein CutA [Candidatus Omnitrophica bacterium]|nr:divalent cation tolerance protein CutA [Candidatus Omnitrophota bacterium]